MGKATIIENLGNGQYRVRLKHDLRALEKALAALKKQRDEEAMIMIRALLTLSELESAKEAARYGLDMVVDQWMSGLIRKFSEAPPPIAPDDPNDPETGQPWADPDRAQDAKLLAAINSARSGIGLNALERNSKLDAAIRSHILYIARSHRATHLSETGASPGDRAAIAGYSSMSGAGECLGLGYRTPETAVNRWKISDAATLFDPNYTEAGVAFKNAPDNPYGYLWGATFSRPGPPTGASEEKDPAAEESKKVDDALNPIKPPTIETLEPQKIASAAAEFARASQKARQARDKIKLLLLERIERSRKIGEMEKAKSRAGAVLEVWACQYEDYLEVGIDVNTAEVPGFYEEPAAGQEHQINLIPPMLNAGGLAPVEGLSAAGVFVNAALEPGHLRWRPIWRYGTILSLSNLGGGWSGESDWTCSVRFADASARMFDREPGTYALNLSANEVLANVPISYPPCNGFVFQVGDEVLVLFEGFDRARPKVIGFRRSPKLCPDGRVSWK